MISKRIFQLQEMEQFIAVHNISTLWIFYLMVSRYVFPFPQKCILHNITYFLYFKIFACRQQQLGQT